MKKYYKEFHKLFEGIIIEVCEGEGTEKDPCRLCFYVYDKELKKIGKIDNLYEWQQIEKAEKKLKKKGRNET